MLTSTVEIQSALQFGFCACLPLRCLSPRFLKGWKQEQRGKGAESAENERSAHLAAIVARFLRDGRVSLFIPLLRRVCIFRLLQVWLDAADPAQGAEKRERELPLEENVL